MKNIFQELNHIRHHQTCILYIIFCDFVFLVPCCEDYDDNDINDFVNIKNIDRILLVMMMTKMIIRFCKGKIKIVVCRDYVSAGKVAVAAH